MQPIKANPAQCMTSLANSVTIFCNKEVLKLRVSTKKYGNTFWGGFSLSWDNLRGQKHAKLEELTPKVLCNELGRRRSCFGQWAGNWHLCLGDM